MVTAIGFSKCFLEVEKGEEKLNYVAKLLPKAVSEIKRLAKKDPRKFQLPEFIDCMSPDEIIEGQSVGGGHGSYEPPNIVKINPNMSGELIYLNYVHENLHHVFPELSEGAIGALTELVDCNVRDLKTNACDLITERDKREKRYMKSQNLV
jgi:hypothetical protein